MGEKPQEEKKQEGHAEEEVAQTRAMNVRMHARAEQSRVPADQGYIEAFIMVERGLWQDAFEHLSEEGNQWEASAQAHQRMHPTCPGWTVLHQIAAKPPPGPSGHPSSWPVTEAHRSSSRILLRLCRPTESQESNDIEDELPIPLRLCRSTYSNDFQ